MPEKLDKDNLVDKSQIYYGNVVHYISIIACLIALVAPLLILLFPLNNILNPNLVYGAIFEGKKSAEIWTAAGSEFRSGDFWPLLFKNLFTPDGFATFGIVLGCSVTLWGLIPAIFSFIKKKEFFYMGVGIFVFALIFLAMSGLVQMAG